MLNVTDDSGFLALVVPSAYKSFVARHWTFDQIMAHFKAQMARRSLLIWGTGLEGFWNVDVVLGQTEARGVREVSGPLQVAGGSLLVTNYESLTMAAAYEDVTLPEKHEQDQLLFLPDGNNVCTIMQMFDSEKEESAGHRAADFVIQVQKATADLPAWETIPWFDATA